MYAGELLLFGGYGVRDFSVQFTLFIIGNDNNLCFLKIFSRNLLLSPLKRDLLFASIEIILIPPNTLN